MRTEHRGQNAEVGMTEHRAKRIEHRKRIEGGAGNGRALRMGNGRW